MITWLIVYKRGGSTNVIRIGSKKSMRHHELFPVMKMWAYSWLKGEVPLQDIDIF